MRHQELFEQKTKFDPFDDHTLWISPEGKVWSLSDQSIQSIPEHEREDWVRDYDINSLSQPAVTHGTWMAYNWEKLFGEEFNQYRHNAYDDPEEWGWVRIRNHGWEFNIQSKHSAAQNVFNVWWPVVVAKMKENPDFMVYIDHIENSKRNSLAFDLPEDKAKLMNWGKA